MSMKEIFDAFAARVKSPIFGFYVFALVGVNWKALFLLFASESPPLERVMEFENSTSITCEISSRYLQIKENNS